MRSFEVHRNTLSTIRVILFSDFELGLIQDIKEINYELGCYAACVALGERWVEHGDAECEFFGTGPGGPIYLQLPLRQTPPSLPPPDLPPPGGPPSQSEQSSLLSIAAVIGG